MSTQQSLQPGSMITIHNLEHPRSITRPIKACLTLAGAAAAGVLAMTVTSPAAYPLFEGLGEEYGTYTDSLGVSVNSTSQYSAGRHRCHPEHQ